MTIDPLHPAAGDLASIAGARTRFAPAPTGWLHLGHLVNAIFVWGIARAIDGAVVLRIEDHDRQRCRPEYEAALLEDLERLALQPDEPPIAALRAGRSAFRQSDDPAPYEVALAVAPRRAGWSTPVSAAARRSPRSRGRPGARGGARAARGGAGSDGSLRPTPARSGSRWGREESWQDLLAGPQVGQPSAAGDLAVRDRAGNWTYPFAVVVDDLRHGIDLVVRGRDLLDATPAQLRLARLLAGRHPARFLHHPLLHRPDGAKLSKADGATAIRELLDAGSSPGELLADAARRVGFAAGPPSLDTDRLADLFRPAADSRPAENGAATRDAATPRLDSGPW